MADLPPKYKWADRYQKEGAETFDPESSKTLRRIKTKYVDDFKAFFSQLDVPTIGKVSSPERQRVRSVISAIDDIGRITDKLSSVMGDKASAEEVDTLASLMDFVDSEFRFFSNPDNLSAVTQRRLKKVEEASGISMTDIVRANAVMKGRMGELSRPRRGLGETFATIAPVLKPLGDMAGEVGMGMLGPFASVAGVAGRAVSGVSAMLKARKERKLNLERRAITQATLLAGEVETGEYETYSEASGRGGSPVSNVLSGFKGRTGRGGARGGESGVFETSAGGRQKREATVFMQQALFDFFNVGAKRAWWTKEVLESVQGKSIKTGGIKTEGENKFGILDMLGLGKAFDMLKGAIVPLGEAALIAGAAFAGWKLGNWLQENLPKTVLGKAVLDTVFFVPDKIAQIGIGMQHSKSLDKLKKSITPLGKRALQLQSQGMSVRDSVEQAQAESEQPLYWDKEGNLHREPLPADWKERKNKASTPEVPIAAPANAAEDMRSLGDIFRASQEEMLEGIKKLSVISRLNDSGRDTRDIGDPLVSGGLNSGMIGI